MEAAPTAQSPRPIRFIDWIWHIRGSLMLAPGQSGDDAFERLDPLFQAAGTSHHRTGDTLVFAKKDAAAQDKLSVFDAGVLRIEQDPAGPQLRYHLISRSLLYCFLAPLLFLGFAQANIAIGNYEKTSAAAAAKKADAKDDKDAALPMNPIDKALGAPAPDTREKTAAEKQEKEEEKNSPTSAYVFAGIFAALYVAGRILEARLVKSLFRKRLLGG